jgi:hypothetical protein
MGQCWRATSPLDDGDIRASVYRASGNAPRALKNIVRSRRLLGGVGRALKRIVGRRKGGAHGGYYGVDVRTCRQGS